MRSIAYRWMMAVVLTVTVCCWSVEAQSARQKKQATTLAVTDLRTERMTNPMSIDTPTPRLGWCIEARGLSDVVQTSYRLIVASSQEKAEALQGDLWDSGTVESDQSQWVTYGGQPLRSNTRCYWRVQVTTTQGTTDWSQVAMWNVGLLTESDWRGRWIGYDHLSPWDCADEHSRLSSRYLRTEFTLDKEVRCATLYISGLGLYEAFINGHKIGDDVLTPMPTDYRRTVLYNAYDVTSTLNHQISNLRSSSARLLPKGRKKSQTSNHNCMAVVLGNGRYYTMQQDKKPWKITRFSYPTLRANLIVEFTDGSRKVIDTNEKDWKVCVDGALRSNNEYDGETYDARKEQPGWQLPGFDDTGWLEAERTAVPLGTLRGQMSPGMKVLQTLKPKSVTRIGDKLIVDMGQNMAGWLKMRMDGLAEGDSVVIRYAERIDSTGNIWTENLRHAQSTDRYYANGHETADTWWHPVFTYHGFRYAEIQIGKRESVVRPEEIENRKSVNRKNSIEDFEGCVVSDAMLETGRFLTTDTILNKVYRNARWGILSNYKGMPVDCPQRDERQPWLGDRTRGCYGEAFLFDNQTLYAKWMRDICEAQREDGCIPDVAPAYWNYYSDNVTWPAALPFGLDMLARQYGDMEPMRRCYPNVMRWLRHLKTQYQREGIIEKDRYGDWCVPPESETLIHSQDSARITDGTLISTAYYYRICQLMSGYARQLGQADDATWLEQEAALTLQAFNRRFLTVRRGTSTVPGHILYPDSTFYGNNTVTANLLPLAFGMTSDDYVRQEVQKQVVKKLMQQNGGTVTCGVIGISWLMHALTDMGRTELAWLLATNRKYPSWGYMAEHGATTIWELWNGDTASPKMNSGNHVMLLGDLLSWLYEDVAGIRPAEPGFKKILLQPDFSVDEMDDIDASYHSIYGPIVSRWHKENGKLYWHIELPANTTATAVMPDGTRRPLGSGTHDIEYALNTPDTHNPVVCSEFLYKKASFPECHSASIVETRKGDLVCTFFGGTKERNPDVCIWVCRKPKGTDTWTAPVMVADGIFASPSERQQAGASAGMEAGEVYREACWNPVIFETPSGELQLYFKIGPNVAGWKGWRITSKDGGKTWSRREQLPDSIYGPIKNKPFFLDRSMEAKRTSSSAPLTAPHSPRLVSPTSDERNGWRCYFELSDDMGRTWRRTRFVEADSGVRAIQPTIIQLPDGRLEALCRTRSRHIGVTYSSDNGETWSRLQFIDTPNNNSGIDAVTLAPTQPDGLPSYALACNDWPIEPDKDKGVRTPLSILRSDDGLNWKHWVTLEDSPISQYSYPSIIQSRDGHLHVVYTWRRQRIKHVELIP